jgi:SulP family sulfate permease
VNSQPLVALQRSGLLDEIGEENLLGDIDEALTAARARLGLPQQLSTASQGEQHREQ